MANITQVRPYSLATSPNIYFSNPYLGSSVNPGGDGNMAYVWSPSSIGQLNWGNPGYFVMECVTDAPHSFNSGQCSALDQQQAYRQQRRDVRRTFESGYGRCDRGWRGRRQPWCGQLLRFVHLCRCKRTGVVGRELRAQFGIGSVHGCFGQHSQGHVQ